jgi:hypothetical protein
LFDCGPLHASHLSVIPSPNFLTWGGLLWAMQRW